MRSSFWLPLGVATLVVGALLGKLLRSIVEMAGLSVLDRMLGMVFGAGRAVLLLLALAVGLRPSLRLDETAWWQDSLLLPHLLVLESWFRAAADSLRAIITGIWV